MRVRLIDRLLSTRSSPRAGSPAPREASTSVRRKREGSNPASIAYRISVYHLARSLAPPRCRPARCSAARADDITYSIARSALHA